MVKIKRWAHDSCVVGLLTYKDFKCFTLELPDLDNQINISCIPDGTYKAKKRFSPSKQYEVVEYIDVPNRTYIQIHKGNFTRQLLGCQAVGDSIKFIDGDDILDVTNSGATFDGLMAVLPDTFDVEIFR